MARPAVVHAPAEQAASEGAMNADEHEARLRDAVLREVDELIIDGIDHGNLPWKYERPNADAVVPALTAYADWLRLRAVAEQPCYIVWPDAVTALKRALTLTAKGKIFRKSGGRVTCLEQAASAPDEEIPLCPPCKAQQQIAAILAAGGAE